MPIVQTMNFDFSKLSFNQSEKINGLNPSIETNMKRKDKKFFKYFGYKRVNSSSQLRYTGNAMFANVGVPNPSQYVLFQIAYFFEAGTNFSNSRLIVSDGGGANSFAIFRTSSEQLRYYFFDNASTLHNVGSVFSYVRYNSKIMCLSVLFDNVLSQFTAYVNGIADGINPYSYAPNYMDQNLQTTFDLCRVAAGEDKFWIVLGCERYLSTTALNLQNYHNKFYNKIKKNVKLNSIILTE